MTRSDVELFTFVEVNVRGLWVFGIIRGAVISWIRRFSVSVKKDNSLILIFFSSRMWVNSFSEVLHLNHKHVNHDQENHTSEM